MPRLLALWILAVALAGLGTTVLYDASPGLNWGVFTGAAAGAILLSARLGRAPVRAVLAVPLGLAAAFGVATAITASRGGHILIVGGVAMLLAMTVLLAGDPRWGRLTAGFMLSAPMAAPLRSMLEAIRRAWELVEHIAGARYRAPLRGGLLALPVVTLFSLFLANADPVLATLRDDLADALLRLEFVPRLLFFLGLLTLALGGSGLALQGAGMETEPVAPATPARMLRLADTERLIVLGSVVVLFTTFLLLQASYIFGNAPVTRGSGVTFAEYARRGFAELTTVAMLCTLLLVALDRWAVRGSRERWTRAVAVVVVVEVEVLLLSALRRLWLYESAYGFTTARLYAHAYMIGVAVFLLLLGWGLSRGLQLGWLARGAAGIAAVTMLVLLYWNHEAWIVRQNVGRGRLDTTYLVWGLSPNAAPALVEAVTQLPPPLADLVRDGLQKRYGLKAPAAAPCRWFEWNRARARAAAALRAGGLARGDVQLHPTGCVVRSPS